MNAICGLQFDSKNTIENVDMKNIASLIKSS